MCPRHWHLARRRACVSFVNNGLGQAEVPAKLGIGARPGLDGLQNRGPPGGAHRHSKLHVVVESVRLIESTRHVVGTAVTPPPN